MRALILTNTYKKMSTLKRQFDKITYPDVASLRARTGFEKNERYDAEVKTVNTTTSDLLYNQKNDTTLSDDGVICIIATADANGTGSKWVRGDAKAVGNFDAALDVALESGAEYAIIGVVATGVNLEKIYQFQRVDSESNQGLELIEEPIITGADTVEVRVRNNTDTTIPESEVINFNWAELGNV